MVIDFITTPIWKALGEETDRAVGAETALKRNTFANAEYVPNEKMIYLSNGFGEVIDSIDCTDFVIDGMVENVSLSGNILTITFNTDAGKQSIDIDLTEFINPQNYYTKTETDNIVNSSFTSAVTYVNSEVLSARTDASAYTDSALVSAKTYTDSEVLSARTDSKTYTDNAIDSAKTYTDAAISNAVSGKTDKVSVTASGSGYKFPNWNDQGCITGVSATAYQASQSINGSSRTVYSDSSEALPIIYAPASAGSAGQPLLSNGSGAPVWGAYKFQFISQSQYDALATKDSTTIYFIVNEN